MEDLLQINNLSVQYRTGRTVTNALNGVSLTIKKGEAVGLVGESGAGKTTTALAALNLLPESVGFVTGGSVLYKGQSVLEMSEQQLMEIRGNKIAMIFQNPLTSLNPLFRVGEQIAMVLRKHKKITKKEAEEEAGELLKLVGIAPYRLKDYPHQFSGGMRQRVGIAAALACSPELLIADEPTTALDVTIQAQILELMKELQTKLSSSLLMITHSFGIISELCQKTGVMYAGVIVEYGPVQQVFEHPKHWYTKGLLAAIPKLEGPCECLQSIPGNVANGQSLPTGCKFHPRCPRCTQQCKNEEPPFIQVDDQHFVACWHVEEES